MLIQVFPYNNVESIGYKPSFNQYYITAGHLSCCTCVTSRELHGTVFITNFLSLSKVCRYMRAGTVAMKNLTLQL